MAIEKNSPKERKMRKDYFFIGVYILVALLIVLQFLVMFSVDIMDMLGIDSI